MNSIKKISLALLSSLTLTTASNADKTLTEIGVNYNSVTIMDIDSTEPELFVGMSKIFDNNIYAGYQVNFGSISATKGIEDTVSTGLDIKLGYSPIKDLALYGLVSGLSQDIGDGALGFGFGGGVNYQLFKHLSISAEYKSYSMTATYSIFDLDYDYDTLGVGVKFTW